MNLLDSHDTPRFLSCASGDKDALKLAWLFMFSYPGAPCIYYGDEIGVDGEHDPGCRKSFPWEESKWDKEFAFLCQRTHCAAQAESRPAPRRLQEAVVGGWHLCLLAFAGRQHICRGVERLESPQQAEVTYEAKNPKVVFGEASDISLADGRLKFKVPARCGVVLK